MAPPMALQLVLSMAALLATPGSGEAGPTVTSRMTIFPGVRPPVHRIQNVSMRTLTPL